MGDRGRDDAECLGTCSGMTRTAPPDISRSLIREPRSEPNLTVEGLAFRNRSVRAEP